MKLSKLMGLIALFLLSIHANAQVELKSEKGSFEEFYPWLDGYLGVSLNYNYGVVPKHRTFQFFDENGKLKWFKKVDPYNFANDVVVSKDSKFAYLINSAHAKTAALEKKSASTFLNLYQINQKGVLKMKSLKYTGELAALKPGAKESVSVLYLDANEDGLILVTTDPKSNSYYLVTISHAFVVAKTKLDFSWNYDDWDDNLISKLNFSRNGDKLSVIQLERDEENVEMRIVTNDLKELENPVEVKHTFDLTQNLFAANTSTDVLSAYESNFCSYFDTHLSGDRYVIEYKLGSLFKYQMVKGQLYGYISTFKDDDQVRRNNPNGFAYFPISVSEAEEFEDLSYVKFSQQSSKTRVMNYSVILDPDVTYTVQYAKGGVYHGSYKGGKEEELGKKILAGEAIGRTLELINEEEFARSNDLFMTKTGYIIAERSRPNAGGGSKTIKVKSVSK